MNIFKNIKTKSIPKDTPDYLRKALERAMKEYDNGIKHEKSALENFAEKYVIDGKPGLTPFKYFAVKATQIKEFLRNHRNIKVRMIMVCIMEKQISEKLNKFIIESKSYFNTETYINLESTDVKVSLSQMIKEILEKISIYQMNGSAWYFKEVTSLEIHIVDYKPIKGSSYIPLPDIIMRKKAIIDMENKDNKCFLWSILRYLHPIEKHKTRLQSNRMFFSAQLCKLLPQCWYFDWQFPLSNLQPARTTCSRKLQICSCRFLCRFLFKLKISLGTLLS